MLLSTLSHIVSLFHTLQNTTQNIPYDPTSELEATELFTSELQSTQTEVQDL